MCHNFSIFSIYMWLAFGERWWLATKKKQQQQKQQIIYDLLNPIKTGNETTTSSSKYPYLRQNHQIHIEHSPIYRCPIHISIMNNIITSMCLWNQLKRLSQCFRSHSAALAHASLSKRPNLTLVKFTKTFPVQIHCRRYHLSICMKLDLPFWMAGKLLRTILFNK